jgi:aspartate/methionine/tyrosine aminotransferase
LRELDLTSSKRPEIIIAGLGKPTFPLDQEVIKASISYWEKFLTQADLAQKLLEDGDDNEKIHNQICKLNAAISYGNPQGDKDARERIARALVRWYKVNIESQNIIFTVGGIGALKIIFNVLHNKFANWQMMTPFPFYPVYAGTDIKNQLHPIHVMNESGYRLTARVFEESLQHGKNIKAFLLCDPNNPLGTITDTTELEKIASILRNNQEIFIVLDEAYAEMRLDGEKHCSLLTIAPDLKHRMILIRSATKGMSAAGERMALITVFDKTLMSEFIKQQTDLCVHPPRSSQHAFAVAMEYFNDKKRRDLANFYRPQVEYVTSRLKKMSAAMPDENYKTLGTFYVVGDFSELLGLDLPFEASKVLNKDSKVQTGEDIAYYLLFKDRIMLTPLSYCGLADDSGYMRITCSGGMQELTHLMDRLENRLEKVRNRKLSKSISSVEKWIHFRQDNFETII